MQFLAAVPRFVSRKCHQRQSTAPKQSHGIGSFQEPKSATCGFGVTGFLSKQCSTREWRNVEKLHSEEQRSIILTSQLKPNNFLVIERPTSLHALVCHLQNRSQQRTHPWVQEQVPGHKNCRMLRQRAAWHHLRICHHFWEAEKCKHAQHLTNKVNCLHCRTLKMLTDSHNVNLCQTIQRHTGFCWVATERSQSQIGSQDRCEDGKATSRHPIYCKSKEHTSMGVFINGGTPKWMVDKGKSH